MRTDPGTVCACQWGICGACDGSSDHRRPRHDQCLSRKHGHPVVYPLTWLLSKQGFVIGPPLWPANGSSCRYICSCSCRKTGPIQAPPRRRPTTEKLEPMPALTVQPAAVLAADEDALFDLEAL